MKKRRGRLFGTLMSAVLLTAELAGVSGLAFGANPVMVQADGGEPVMQFGTEGIETGDWVNYGLFDVSDLGYAYGTTVYRVLDNAHDNSGGEGAMFVMSEGLWDGGVGFDNNHSNEWQGSSAQGWCTEFCGVSLSPTERNELEPVDKTETAQTVFGVNWKENTLNGDTDTDVDLVFFLSAKEIRTYIGDDEDDLVAKKGNLDEYGDWWTRSGAAGNDDAAGQVAATGNVRLSPVSSFHESARPAFNINTDSVFFSMAGDKDKDDYSESTPVKVSGNADVDTWSLTFLSGGLWAEFDGASSNADNPHKIMLSNFDRSQEGNRASVIITDKEYVECNGGGASILYYGAIDEDDNSFIIPDELALTGWGTDYFIYIFEEYVDYESASDCASWPQELQAPGTFYGINVVAAPENGGTAEANSDVALEDATVKLTATARAGFKFKNWEVVEGDVTIADVNKANTTFVMTDGDVTVRAVFEEADTYTVTVTAGTGGTASADCEEAAEGEIVTLTAAADAGYKFKEWSVTKGDIVLENKPSVSFEMPAGPVSVTAVFEALAEDETSVTVTAGKGGKAEADKLSAKAGDEVKITAEADKDYEFDKWTVVSGDIEIADEKEADTTFVVNSVDEPIEIEAVFKKADPNGGKEPSGHNHHQCEKGHLYAYTICQAPTTEVDGYATWRCARCGIIDPLHADELDEEGFIVIPAFPVFNSTLNDNIKGAKDNATVSISTKRWTGVSRTVLASLAERKDVTLEISFVYMNVEYVITLKGDDPRLAELLNMEVKDNCLGLKLIYDYVNAPAIQ